MKKILCILVISQLLSSYALSKKKNLDNSNDVLTTSLNKIDDLQTTEDVIKFAKLINPDFDKDNFGQLQIKSADFTISELKNCDLYKTWEIKNWQKVDLNNDSKTDLIFTGYWYSTYHQYVITGSDSDQYELFDLSDKINYACKILKPIVINNKNELLVNNHKTDPENVLNQKMIHFVDTLTYKFNSFIEKNNKKADYYIEHIKFICEDLFEIQIDDNQNAHYACLNVYNASSLKEKYYKGESRKKIEKAVFEDVSGLLEYINVSDLPNEYSIDGYDFETVWLEIKFKNGTVKKIRDYGRQGTYGLNAVYNKMKNIALRTDWK